jgi:hypothetical protein
MTYQFTSEQLVKLLQDTCVAYEEYRGLYGYKPSAARLYAIGEVLDGMTAERELQADGVHLEPSHTVSEGRGSCSTHSS